MSARADVVINRRAAARLDAGHVWVYRSDLVSADSVAPGSLVRVRDERNHLLGSALYSSASQIALRLLGRERVHDNELLRLLQQRIREAIDYRRRFVAGASNAYRVIFSEADLLPGLVVDRYNDILAVQPLTQAMDREDIRSAIVDALLQCLEPEGISSIVAREDAHIRQLEQLPQAETRLLRGQRTSAIYQLNGVNFEFDALSGQKTGAFLDQRENYAAAQSYARGAALDVFCYQGGFALHLARKCESVSAVDSSRPALEAAERNEKLNPGAPEIEWIEGNAFDLLKDYSSREAYDTVVLDPPAFAKNKRAVETALRGYKELNLRALKMLKPGGILVTCSCSFHVGEQEFRGMLASAAADARRSLRILQARSQSKDHPIVVTIPETHYLKCLICTV